MDKKRILILNGGYSEIPLINAAKELNLYVVVTGNNDSLPGNKFADKYVKCDYSDSEQIAKLAVELHIDYVCSGCTDFAYFSTVYTSEKLDLPGHDSLEITNTLHYKNLFRAFIKRIGLPFPQYVEISLKDFKNKTVEAYRLYLKDKIKNIEFPLIVKPIDMMGGIGVKKCNNIDEIIETLNYTFDSSRSNKVLIEEFITGDNHGFTTIIRDSKVVFYMADKEYHDFNDYAVSGTQTYFPEEIESMRLIEQIEKISSELRLVDGLVHLQYKVKKDGTPVIIEIMRRCPGDQYPLFVQYAAGVEYAKWIVKGECGFDLNDVRQSKIEFVGRQVLICNQEGCIKGLTFLKNTYENNIIQINAYIPDNFITVDLLPKKMGAIFLKFKNEFEMDDIMSSIKDDIVFDYEKMTFDRKKSDTERTIDELKKHAEKGIYIYGVTETARRAKNILENHGLEISGFAVDDEFLTAELREEGIRSISEIISMNTNIVIGYYLFGNAYRKINNGFFNNSNVYFINREPLFDYGYYIENKKKFDCTLELFDDELSKKTMHAYMDGRMNGFSRPLYEVYQDNQYFIPEIEFGDNEVYFDCGMYDGDTIIEFIKKCPNFKKIIGFEPDSNNIELFNKRKLNDNRIEVVNEGCYSEKCELRFNAGNSTASVFEEDGDVIVPVTTIDSFYDENRPVTFIKMDIEGSELAALKGARKVIENDFPKLAICVYHKKEDLITIPQYIRSLENEKFGYNLLLRHHSLHDHETVLYALPYKK